MVNEIIELKRIISRGTDGQLFNATKCITHILSAHACTWTLQATTQCVGSREENACVLPEIESPEAKSGLQKEEGQKERIRARKMESTYDREEGK